MCSFVFTYAKIRVSHEAAHLKDGRVAALKEEEDDGDDSSLVSQDDDEEDGYEPAAKRPDLDLDEDSNMSAELKSRRPLPLRQVRQVPDDEKGILKESLMYIQRKLQA